MDTLLPKDITNIIYDYNYKSLYQNVIEEIEQRILHAYLMKELHYIHYRYRIYDNDFTIWTTEPKKRVINFH